jgi:hypothetical protein
MARYRIYLLTAPDHIDDYRAAECASDAEAEWLAGWLLQDHPAAEIWCGKRRVARVFCTREEFTPTTNQVLTDTPFAERTGFLLSA